MPNDDRPIIRVPRTSDEPLLASAARGGIPRGALAIALSVTSLIISIAVSGIALYKWLDAERGLTVNETWSISAPSKAQMVVHELETDPNSHPLLRAELDKLYDNLEHIPPSTVRLSPYERAAYGVMAELYARPISTNINLMSGAAASRSASALATTQNSHEGVKMQKSEVDARMAKEVTNRVIPALSDSVANATTGDYEILRPPGSISPGALAPRKSRYPPNEDALGPQKPGVK